MNSLVFYILHFVVIYLYLLKRFSACSNRLSDSLLKNLLLLCSSTFVSTCQEGLNFFLIRKIDDILFSQSIHSVSERETLG